MTRQFEALRPSEHAVLQFTVVITRMGVDEPRITAEVCRQAERPDWPITGVVALAEAALLEFEMPLEPDFPTRLALLVGPLFYAKQVYQVLFGDAAPTLETWVTCKVIKIRWKGTPHWTLAPKPQQGDEEVLPLAN